GGGGNPRASALRLPAGLAIAVVEDEVDWHRRRRIVTAVEVEDLPHHRIDIGRGRIGVEGEADRTVAGIDVCADERRAAIERDILAETIAVDEVERPGRE